MAFIDGGERPDYIFVGGETEVLSAMLDRLRGTFLMKCDGLEEDQLKRRSVLPSELTLFDLLAHLTGAERHWFQECLLGITLEPLSTVPPDGGLEESGPTPTEVVRQRYLAACEASRRAAAAHSLDEVVPSATYECPVSLRFITVHMIEEYARHCGHADLLRETIDGATGE
jgi:hypothetical protein